MNQNTNTGFGPEPTSMSQQPLQLSDCLSIVLKRIWWAIAVFVAVVGIITVKTFMTTPVYKATANVLIEKQYSSEHSIDSVTSSGEMTREYYQTQSRLLVSNSLIRDVIKELGFGQDKTTTEEGSLDTLFDASYMSDMIDWDMSDLIDWYLSNLEVEEDMGSQLISISFLSSHPEIAVRVANAHADVFISRNIKKQSQDYEQALDWLNTQLEKQRIKLQESEMAMVDYEEGYDLLSFKRDDNVVSRKLDELNNMLVQIDTKQIEKQTVYNQLEKFSLDKEEFLFLSDIEKNTIINQLRKHLVDLKTERLRLDSLYGYKHPEIIDINSRIKNLEQEIFDEVHRIRKAIKAELDSLGASEETVKRALDEQKQFAKTYSEKSIDYDELMRQRESDQNLYDSLLKQARELSVLSNTKKTNVSVADKAVLPRYPVRPRKAVNISLSLALGLVCGLGLAFFIEYMDKSVRTPEDVASRLGLQVIGILPYDNELNLEKKLALPSNEFKDRNEAPRDGYHYNAAHSLICGFPVKRPGMSGQVLLIESTSPGEGKTTIVAKSAVSLAKGGMRVVMVDTDHQRSTLHKHFDMTNHGHVGLLNAMKGIISRTIQHGDLDNCSLDDLFFLISLKNQNGRLVIKNDTQTMTALFDNGQLFHLQHKDTPHANRLGTMLLRGDIIREGQLEDALERNRRTGQPLGYILVNAGYINQDQLQGLVKLQIEEHLQRLFSWKHGTFDFEPGDIETHVDKKIYFHEDYTPTINRLGRRLKSRFLESEILSNIKSLDVPNLSILPAGQENGRKVEGPIYYALLEKILDLLKQRYDVVLIDTPPLLYTGGIVKPLLQMVDGVIFVLKSGKVSVKQVNEAKSILKESGINVIGTILNQVRMGKHYYDYYQNT